MLKLNAYLLKNSIIKKLIKIIFTYFLKKYELLKVHLHYKKIKKISKRNLKKIYFEKIYICHHLPLIKRKLILENELKKFRGKIEWVDKFLPDQIVDSYEKLINLKNLNIDPTLPGIDQNQYLYHKNAGRKISISEYSLYLKMKYCFEDQIKKQRKTIIILEDDILLDKNIENYLNICAFEFTKHYPKLDCLMIGTAFNFKSKYFKKNKIIHYGNNQLTRCTHAMMFSLEAAKKIYKNLERVNWPIDYKLNEIIIQESLKVAWAEPGLFQSSIFIGNKTSIFKVNH